MEAFGGLCFSSKDEAAMAAALAHPITTTFSSVPSSSFAFPPSPSPPSPSSPSLESRSTLPTSRSPSPLRFSLSPAPTLPVASSARSPAVPAPWWRRVLDALWVGAKMCVMFSLMSVLWVILAVPTIDQQLGALFRFLCRRFSSAADGHDEAQKPSRTKRSPAARRPQALQQDSGAALRIRDDDDDGTGECAPPSEATEAKPRLSGSQELKKSEEGDNVKEETIAEEDARAVTVATLSSSTASNDASKPKRKKRVRWSDDASQE